MLILRRKEGEGIQIGSDIMIKIVRMSEGSVRVGIEAPEDINIRRDEIPPEERDKSC